MPLSLLRSALLDRAGVRHGFTQRQGGVSRPPFDSLNLGRSLGDDPASVEENHRRLALAVGYAALYEVSQVHGARALCPTGDEDALAFRRHEADALVAGRAGVAVGVRVADCLPLLLADPNAGAVAAVHAGWRGAVGGVVTAAVRRLVALGSDPATLRCAIGPHIGPCCFEVGEDVARQLAAAAPDASGVVRPTAPRPHVELARVVRSQLIAAGVSPQHVDQLPGCTHCDGERFFSYRRDGAASGRHLAVIVAGC